MSSHNHDNESFNKLMRQDLYDLRRQIGRNMHALRHKHKMPLKKLSRLTKMHPAYLDKIELGKCRIEFYHLIRLAAAFEVPPERLFIPFPSSQSRLRRVLIPAGL